MELLSLGGQDNVLWQFRSGGRKIRLRSLKMPLGVEEVQKTAWMIGEAVLQATNVLTLWEYNRRQRNRIATETKRSFGRKTLIRQA